MNGQSLAKPRVSIVVVPRESFAHSLRSLESLYETAAGVDFEVIYVDGSTPRRLRSKLQRAASERGFRLVSAEPPHTPNRMRNLGRSLARGEFIVFADNDLIYEDGWLARLVECAVETGADVVGPLICIGDPPFGRIHSAGGDAFVDERSGARSFREVHRLMDVPLTEKVMPVLVREPMNLVEFHCMLVRASIFDRIGPLDEELASAGEHWDLSMTVRGAGGRIVFEPASRVNQLLPLPFTRDLSSVPFFLDRWAPRRNAQSMARICTKYDIPRNDPNIAAYDDWLALRRQLVFWDLLTSLRRMPVLQPLRKPVQSLNAMRRRRRERLRERLRA